ncbi:MAG: M56 family metallopeptidase, partial [Lachnospiraceae bacterium]|nr:M56 family metallopeptidase [Lachnospiraceae bacterium]
MKFFYENRLGSRLFFRWTMLSMKHVGVCWLYLCGVFLYGFLVLRKRHRFKKLISGLEKRWLEGTAVYVADGPVTPSATGVLHPKIVMPGIILEGYGRDEIEMILLHEKLHIRLGHLLFYLLWDILRVLLWINPLLTAGMKFLREDMEEICDRAAIRRSGGNARAYGQVLLKSMRLLQTAEEELHGCASFTGGDRSENRRFPGSFLRKYRGQARDMHGYKYEKTRQRIARIAGYRPYRRRAAIGAAAAAVLCVAGALTGLQRISYARYSADESVLVYGYDDGEGVVFVDNSDELRRMISYDDSYVYVDRGAFERFLDGRRRAEEEIFIVFGGFYKLPGFGSGGSSCCYEIVSEDKEA